MRVSREQMRDFLGQHDPVWEVPVLEWDHGIPLGNGHIGAMLWGDPAEGGLRISLDKYDCWELREQTPDPEVYNWEHLKQLVTEHRDAEAREEFRDRYREHGGVYPTRLPMPRMEIDLGSQKTFEARLGLYGAQAEGTIGDVRWQALVHATRNIICIDLQGAGSVSVAVRTDHLNEEALEKLAAWGYEQPERGEDGDRCWLRQRLPAGGEYVVAWQIVRRGDAHDVVLVSFVTHNDADDPLAEALALIAPDDLDSLRDEHAQWWADYWQRSALTVPDAHLEALYCIEMYKLGCSTRADGLPISLQGVWTVDGEMPPWSGDYHLDSNLQQSYWPVYAGNRLELGESLYQTFDQCMDRWRSQCREFFGFDGIWGGCAMGPGGERIYGYHGVEFWPGNAAWLAHGWWLHWLYSQDRDFLQRRAFPFLKGCLQTYQGLLEEGEDGRLHLPLAYSPEWGEGTTARYGADPACDIALMRWLAEALVESVATLGIDDPDAAGWRELLDRLADYPQGADGIHVTEGQPLVHSHRHHSHLMGIHPMGVLTVDGSDEERDLIERSMNHLVITGMGQWAGHGMGPSAMIAARVARGNMAWLHCDIYARCFITPATIHTNGDYRRFGMTRFTNRPMTIEGGFAIAAALMEMVLQSWGGTIRLFPAIPDHWHDLCFEDLRTEGAFTVSAALRDGEVADVRIASEVGGTCRLLSPWPDRGIIVRGPDGDLELEGDRIQWQTEAGSQYLVFAADGEPSEENAAPALSVRPERERHHFGVKRHARF